MVTTSMGTFLPLAAIAIWAMRSIPEQHGTSICRTVMLLISFELSMSVSLLR